MIRGPVGHFIRRLIVLLLLAGVARAGEAPGVVTGGAQITGVVTGGAQLRGVYVAALKSRNLRESDSVVTIAPAGVDGRFSLPLPPGLEAAWLVVTERCDPRRLDCRRTLPLVDLAHAGQPVRLEVPDAALAQALWSGEPIASRHFMAVGWAAVGALLLAALLLWRRRDLRPLPARQLAPWIPALVAFPVVVGLSLVRLGQEPLDLLEYTYFHEALRPASVAALLTDSLSTELAHGPVYPLLLRTVAGWSVDPFWLRFPSVLLGGGFVLLLGVIVGRGAGPRAALGALFLSAVSPVVAYYARDATPYSLVGFLSALAVLLADLRAAGLRNAARWAAFALVHTLGFFAHYGFAFFSLAQGLGLLVGGLVLGQRRSLSYPALAFAAAAVLPVLSAPHLERMLASSGLRFGLMSSVYPLSPGLDRFLATMLSVLTGGPAGQPVLLLGAALILTLGLRVLWRTSPLLAAQAGACMALMVVWLVFSHTMSVAYGGGRIYWAFRWARPLLVGVLAAAGAAAVSPLGRWLVTGQVLVGAFMLTTGVAPPVRPDETRVASWVRERAVPGDAFAVLPASFYGDQTLYYVSAGSPPALVTGMRTHRVPTPLGDLTGPYVELETPLETAVDRLQHRRLFVVAFDEHLFGVRKFSPAPQAQLLAALSGWTELDHLSTPFLSVWHFECGESCVWRGQARLAVRFEQTLEAERYLERPPGVGSLPFDLPLKVVVPDGALEARLSLDQGDLAALTVSGGRLLPSLPEPAATRDSPRDSTRGATKRFDVRGVQRLTIGGSGIDPAQLTVEFLR